jgi:hypothetical protein
MLPSRDTDLSTAAAATSTEDLRKDFAERRSRDESDDECGHIHQPAVQQCHTLGICLPAAGLKGKNVTVLCNRFFL